MIKKFQKLTGVLLCFFLHLHPIIEPKGFKHFVTKLFTSSRAIEFLTMSRSWRSLRSVVRCPVQTWLAKHCLGESVWIPGGLSCALSLLCSTPSSIHLVIVAPCSVFSVELSGLHNNSINRVMSPPLRVGSSVLTTNKPTWDYYSTLCGHQMFANVLVLVPAQEII